MHQGHCEGNWIGPKDSENEYIQPTIMDCRNECESRAAGYFAYEPGSICACYTKEGGCKNDGTHQNFFAYEILPRENKAGSLYLPKCPPSVTFLKILVFINFHIIFFFIVIGASSTSSVYQNDVERFGSRYTHSGIVTRNHFQSDVEKSPWLKVTEFDFKCCGYLYLNLSKVF